MFPATAQCPKSAESALLPCSALSLYKMQEAVCLVVAVWEIECERAALTIWDGTWPKYHVQRDPYNAVLLEEEPFLVDCLRAELLHVVVIGKCNTAELLTMVGSYACLKGIQLLPSATTKQLHIVLDLRYERHSIAKISVPPPSLEALLNNKKAHFNEMNMHQDSLQQTPAKGYSEVGNPPECTQSACISAESQDIIFDTETTSCTEVADKNTFANGGAKAKCGIRTSEISQETCSDIWAVDEVVSVSEVVPVLKKPCKKTMNDLNSVYSIIDTEKDKVTELERSGITVKRQGGNAHKEINGGTQGFKEEPGGIAGSSGTTDSKEACVQSNILSGRNSFEVITDSGKPDHRAKQGNSDTQSSETSQSAELTDVPITCEEQRNDTFPVEVIAISSTEYADEDRKLSPKCCSKSCEELSEPACALPDSTGCVNAAEDLDAAIVHKNGSTLEGLEPGVTLVSQISASEMSAQASDSTAEPFGLNPTILQVTECGKPTLYKSLPPVVVTHERDHLKPISIAALKARKPPFQCRIIARIADVLPDSTSPRNFIWGTCIKCSKSIALSNLVRPEDRVPRRLPCPMCGHTKLSLRFLLVFRLVDPSGTVFSFAKCKDANNLLAGHCPEDACDGESLGAKQVARLLRQLRPQPKPCEQTFVDIIISSYKDHDGIYYRIVHTCARMT